MAVSSTIQYCTNRDLQDVLPNVEQYDLKRRIYNWTKSLDLDAGGAGTDNLDLYYSANTGVPTEMFYNGVKIDKITFPTTQNTLLDGAASIGATVINVDAGHTIEAGDILKIDDEYIYVAEVSTNAITAVRGILNSNPSAHANDANVYLVIDLNLMNVVGSNESPISFVYDSSEDMILLILDNVSPNDAIVETGDDWATIVQRFCRRASRLVESKIDARIAGEIWKDRENNYPEVIVRCAALQAAILLLSAQDPESAFIEPFKSELEELIDGLNKGTIILPHQRSIDSSSGIIRTVSQHASSDLFPVEIKGEYGGVGYELLKVFIDTSEGGIIGTARMTVVGKDGDKLKNETLIDSEIITGDFQSLGAGSLQIRWSGDDVTTAICTVADEYEIEVWGKELGASTPGVVGSVTMTRR